MAGSGIDVESISSLKTAVSTLTQQLDAVLSTAKSVTDAGDEVVAATGTDTSTAAAFASEAQTLHSEEFKNAQQSLNNYIDFLNNSYAALEEAEAGMTKNTTTYANTGGN